MHDVFEVAELLISRAVARHGDDIELVAYYGSRARGTARDDSDLDIFYTPRDGTHPPVGKAFLLEGRLFDFWAIPWGTLEGFATGRIRGFAFAPAVVHHAKVLHARNEEVTDRLAGLKERVREQLAPEARPRMVRRALRAFREVLADLGNARLASGQGGLPAVRAAGWALIRSVLECLALANQRFFDHGFGPALSELEVLGQRPDHLEALVREIATSDDPSRVLRAAERLAVETRSLLLRIAESLPAERSVPEQFRGAYPELRDMVTKLLRACGDGEPVRAGAAAWTLETELRLMLAATGEGAVEGGFHLPGELAGETRAIVPPYLLATPAEDLDTLARHARRLDDRLRRWLAQASVDLEEYRGLAELREALGRSRE